MAPPASPRRPLLSASLPPEPALREESAAGWPSATLVGVKPANTEQAILEALARLGPGAGGPRALLEAPASGGPGARGPAHALADPHATVAGDLVVTAVRRLPAAPAM